MGGCNLIVLSAALVLLAWLFSWDGRNYGVPYISHGIYDLARKFLLVY